jgi:hypothetical protein
LGLDKIEAFRLFALLQTESERRLRFAKKREIQGLAPEGGW